MSCCIHVAKWDQRLSGSRLFDLGMFEDLEQCNRCVNFYVLRFANLFYYKNCLFFLRWRGSTGDSEWEKIDLSYSVNFAKQCKTLMFVRMLDCCGRITSSPEICAKAQMVHPQWAVQIPMLFLNYLV